MSIQHIHSYNCDASQKKTEAQRERELWIASGKYMLGEISAEELEETERPHVENLKKAVLDRVLHKLLRK